MSGDPIQRRKPVCKHSIGKYYPYGQEKPSATTNGTEKFTGYFRDSETGFDYASQRYHNPGTGRFLTPDRKFKSARLTNPGSWNRYSYVLGDPINGRDPTGLDCNALDDLDDYGDDFFSPQDCTPVVSSTLIFPTSCDSSDTVDPDGSCDPLPPALQAFGALLNQNNPGGLISFLILAAVGQAMGGNLAMVAEDASYAVSLAGEGAVVMLGDSANPSYTNIGGITGATFLDNPMWPYLTDAQKLSVETDFMQAALSSGDTFVFTSNPANAPAGSWTAWEANWLEQQGFSFSTPRKWVLHRR